MRVCEILREEVQDEASAFGKLGIDVDVAIHLDGHLLADGQAKSVASSEVANFKEGLENVLALLLGDDGTRVGDKELVLVGSAFLEFQPDVSVLGRIESGIVEQMEEDV